MRAGLAILIVACVGCAAIDRFFGGDPGPQPQGDIMVTKGSDVPMFLRADASLFDGEVR